MADDRKTQDRFLYRCYECHRLEEQLWSLAYEQVWPVIRGKPKTIGATTNQLAYERPQTSPQQARSA